MTKTFLTASEQSMPWARPRLPTVVMPNLTSSMPLGMSRMAGPALGLSASTQVLRCLLEDLSNIIMSFNLGLGRQGPPHGFCAWYRKSQNFRDRMGTQPTKLQVKLPSPGLLPRMAVVAPTPLDLEPRMAVAAVAPTPRSTS